MITVNNQYIIEWQPDTTVQDVLDTLRFTFRMIIVKVDGKIVQRCDYATTPVPDGAIMEAMHLISGG